MLPSSNFSLKEIILEIVINELRVQKELRVVTTSSCSLVRSTETSEVRVRVWFSTSRLPTGREDRDYLRRRSGKDQARLEVAKVVSLWR